MLLEASSDKKLAMSMLRIAYAFIIASLAILLCGIASLCSSVICYELLLLKNAFYIALYFVSMCFLLTFFLHVYSSKRTSVVHEPVAMSTVSSASFKHHSTTQEKNSPPPARPKRHVPVGGHALPGMTVNSSLPISPSNSNEVNDNNSNLASGQPNLTSETHTDRHNKTNQQHHRSANLLSSFRCRDRVWPIATTSFCQSHPVANNRSIQQQQQRTPTIIGGLKSSMEKLFVLPETSNLILKLFIIALSFPSMLYAVFRLAVAIERYQPQYYRNQPTSQGADPAATPCLMSQLEIIQFILLVFFIPFQAFYVFKYGRIFSRRSPIVSGIALTHLLVCNFATWFEMFTVETPRFHFRASMAVFDYYPVNATAYLSARTNTTLSGATSSYLYCFDSSTTVRRASSEAAPFLYPLFTHYLLLVCIPLLRLLFAVSAENGVKSDDDYLSAVIGDVRLPSLSASRNGREDGGGGGSNSPVINSDFPCECRHSNKGLFVNLFVIVALTSLILAAHFLSAPPSTPTSAQSGSNSARSATVRLAYYTAQIAVNSIIILALPLAWRGLFQLDRVPHRDSSPDPRRSVAQYNIARCSVTLITLAFTLLYYLAIIIVHSASLSQLVISYWKYHKSGGTVSASSNTMTTTVTTRQIVTTRQPIVTQQQQQQQTTTRTVAVTTRTPTSVFFMVCPTATENNNYAGSGLNKTPEQYVLAFSPAITAPAIVASALAIGRAVSSSLLAISQVALAVLADYRSALTEKQLDRKPGRSLVMFILTSSLIAWALEIAFELHTSSIGDAVATFHNFSPAIFDVGDFIWPLFAVITVPLMVAFRLFIAIWLYDNWIKCYSPTVI